MTKDPCSGIAKVGIADIYARTGIDHEFAVGRPYKTVPIHQANPLAVLLIIVGVGVLHPFADEPEEVGCYIPVETVGVGDRLAGDNGFPSIVGVGVAVGQVGGISEEFDIPWGTMPVFL